MEGKVRVQLGNQEDDTDWTKVDCFSQMLTSAIK